MSLTQVFTTPVYGRHFFEAVIRDNLDLGRPDPREPAVPDSPDATHTRHQTSATRRASLPMASHPACTSSSSTRTSSSISKSSAPCARRPPSTTRSISSAPKAWTPCRTCAPSVGRSTPNFWTSSASPTEPSPHRHSLSVCNCQLCHRLASASQHCASATHARRRYFGALCRFSHLPDGFRNRDLRPLVAALLGRDLASYSAGAMTYDLRRLRLHGVIRRAPHTLRYTLTADGMRAAFLYTTLYRRLRRPHAPTRSASVQLPSRLDAALHHLDSVLQDLWTRVQTCRLNLTPPATTRSLKAGYLGSGRPPQSQWPLAGQSGPRTRALLSLHGRRVKRVAG